MYVISTSSTAVKHIRGYSTTNGKFMCLEPHFQISATRSGWKVTKTAVASPHSRECTKEPMSPLRNIGSMEMFGAINRAERRNILCEKWRSRGGSNCRFERRFGKKKGKCEHCNTGGGILALPRYRHWLRVLLYSAI